MALSNEEFRLLVLLAGAIDAITGKLQVEIPAGSVTATTTEKSTAAAPTYVEGSSNPLSGDLSGNLRTTLATALPAGAAVIGKFSTDQTTHGTTDLVAADITKVAGAAIAQGHGTAAAAIRVELPSDGTGSVTTAAIGVNGSAVKTSSELMGVSDGTNQQPLIAPIALADAVNGNNSLAAGLYGFNGATWDRVRTDTTAGLWTQVKASALPTGAATAANQSLGSRPKVVTTTFTPAASGTYSNGLNIGGKLTFATGLPAGTAVLLDYFQLAFVATSLTGVAPTLNALFFSGNPATTFTDGLQPAINAADAALLARGAAIAAVAGSNVFNLWANGSNLTAIEAVVDGSGNIYAAVMAGGAPPTYAASPGTATATLGLRY